jgi:uncharacterized phage-associated protein
MIKDPSLRGTEMRRVTFRFDSEKLVHVIAFLAYRGVNDLTKLKTAKLVYFLDKSHLWQYGRPVVGGPYYCMPFGPVPGKALSTLDDLIDSVEVDQPFSGPSSEIIERYLSVDVDGNHPRFVGKQDFDPDIFSQSEISALTIVLEKYGNKTANQLVTLTHKDPTWTIPNSQRVPGSRVDLPYHLFFEDAPADVRQIWSLIEAEQEERDFDDHLDPENAASAESE